MSRSLTALGSISAIFITGSLRGKENRFMPLLEFISTIRFNSSFIVTCGSSTDIADLIHVSGLRRRRPRWFVAVNGEMKRRNEVDDIRLSELNGVRVPHFGVRHREHSHLIVCGGRSPPCSLCRMARLKQSA
jgi:hypothetical protein